MGHIVYRIVAHACCSRYFTIPLKTQHDESRNLSPVTNPKYVSLMVYKSSECCARAQMVAEPVSDLRITIQRKG